MKVILAAAALAATCATPALADYYIVQEPTTKRCTVVEQRPGPGAGLVIGDRGFGVRLEAENQMRTTEVCREGTTGERPGGAVIEERREERRVR